MELYEVDSNNLEHGSRMSSAGFPSFLGFRSKDDPAPTFWLLEASSRTRGGPATKILGKGAPRRSPPVCQTVPFPCHGRTKPLHGLNVHMPHDNTYTTNQNRSHDNDHSLL